MPALPPALASSSAVVWQPLCSPSAHYHHGASSASLPSSSVAVAGVSLDSASARWPFGSTMAPSSLCPLAMPGSLICPAPPWSGVDHPAPQDSTPPAAPRPSSGSVRLLHPLGSSSVLCCYCAGGVMSRPWTVLCVFFLPMCSMTSFSLG